MHQFYSLCSQIIGGIVVCLLIISFSVTLTLNFRPLYYADIQNLHITELSGREEKDIRSNYDALIDYTVCSIPAAEVSNLCNVRIRQNSF